MPSSVPPVVVAAAAAAQAAAGAVNSGSVPMPSGTSDTAGAGQSVSPGGCEMRNSGDSYSVVRAAATLQQEGAAEAAVLGCQRSEKGVTTGVVIPPPAGSAAVTASGVDGGIVAGGLLDGVGDSGSVDEGGSSANGSGLGLDKIGLPAASEGESWAPPQHPQRRNDAGARSPPPAIPTPSAVVKPVLAEWMKDEGVDDSDGDTASSLPGGTPGSKSSTFSSAAAAAAAAAAQAAGGEMSSLFSSSRSLPGTQEGSVAAATEMTSALPSTTGGDESIEGAMSGGVRNGKANGAGGDGAGAGTTRWKLADWIKQGGVDDSDADTNASG